MSNYTKQDADVLMLEIPDRVNFEIDMAKYNVDKNAEISQGTTSIGVFRDPEKLAAAFKNPKQLAVVIMTVLCFIMLIVTIILVILYIIFKYLIKDEESAIQLLTIVKYSICILLLLVLFYYLYNKVVIESNSLISLVKQSERNVKS